MLSESLVILGLCFGDSLISEKPWSAQECLGVGDPEVSGMHGFQSHRLEKVQVIKTAQEP